MRALRSMLPMLALGLALATGPAAAAGDDVLYRAWGGKPGLAAVMDDFVQRLRRDTRTAAFFRETNAQHLAAQLTEQLCQLAGGPCVYDGPSMREAHAELGVTRADFLALVELLQDAMDAHAVPWPAQRSMLARLAPMHRDIVAPAP